MTEQERENNNDAVTVLEVEIKRLKADNETSC